MLYLLCRIAVPKGFENKGKCAHASKLSLSPCSWPVSCDTSRRGRTYQNYVTMKSETLLAKALLTKRLFLYLSL